MINLELEAGETGSLNLPLEDEDVVKIITIHSAKGLEFRYVILPDLVDKKFPTIKRVKVYLFRLVLLLSQLVLAICIWLKNGGCLCGHD